MTDWNKLKVVDLKNELKRRGLPQTGLKPALVARLTEAENEEASESDATAREASAEDSSPKAPSDEGDEKGPIESSSSADIGTAAQAEALAATNIPQPEEAVVAAPTTPEAVSAQGTLPDARDITQDDASATTQPTAQTDEKRPSLNSLPSVDPQELIADQQKRKRRSTTPPPKEDEVARKRARREQPDDIRETLNKPEDDDIAYQNVNSAARDSSMEKELQGSNDDQLHKPDQNEATTIQGKDRVMGEFPSKAMNSQLKDILSPPIPTNEQIAPLDGQMDYAMDETERDITPAIHPATSALYIRDFMRPLNPAQLKHHLATLAAPPNHEPDPELILNFYIDPIRSHALVLFANISAASRVRSAIHDRIWPEERTRKPLWADFIPAENVNEWIEIESSEGGGRSSAKKWEVYYNVDEDQHVTASLQEVGAPASRAPRRLSITTSRPSSSMAQKGVEGAPSGPRSSQINGRGAAANLSTLDQLFRSTKTKPVLYWQPVPKELTNKRLDNLADAKSKDPNRRLGSEINRYTFEDGEVLVDRGKEIFSGIRPPNRSARGGGPGSRSGGSHYGGRGVANRSVDGHDSYDYRERDRGSYRDDRRASRDSRDRRW
ncbi:hypothetical protein F5884DRAFT_802830 [Xylogone sp. PMI_703]|nr:hypothetical protein F5884DRAFT_802830 [Xylogone sp. PMI_703]